jgi:hypothetical protein
MSPFDSSPHARLSTLLVVLGSLTLLHAKSFLSSGLLGGSEDGGFTPIDSGQVPSDLYLAAGTHAPGAFLDDGGGMTDTFAGAPSAAAGMNRFGPGTGYGYAGAGDISPAFLPAGGASHAYDAFSAGSYAGGRSQAAGDFASGGGGSGNSASGFGFQANGGSGEQSRGNSGGGSGSGGGVSGLSSEQGTNGSVDDMDSGEGKVGEFSSLFGDLSSTTGYIVNSSRLAVDDSTAAVGLHSPFTVDPFVAAELGDDSAPGMGPLSDPSDFDTNGQIAGTPTPLADAIGSDQARGVDSPLVAEVPDAAGTLGLLVLGLGLLATYARRVREQPAPAC